MTTESQLENQGFSNLDTLIDAIERQIAPMDSCFSSQTQALAKRFNAVAIDMTALWVQTPTTWTCPACGRAKPDLVRLNRHGQLMCRLVEHHDHMQDLLVKKFAEISTSRDIVVADEIAENFAKRAASMVSAYENTIICNDCNGLDPKAKQAVGTHPDFSFSPYEIRRFAEVRPNEVPQVDVAVAKEIWERQRDTFFLRLRIVDRIAEIAATNVHWFQAGDHNNQPAYVRARADEMARYFNVPSYLDVLCETKKGSKAATDLAAWRKRNFPSPSTVPTPGEVAHVAKVTNTSAWRSVDDAWRCPACNRLKVETVRRSSKEGKWTFSLATAWYRDPAAVNGRTTLTVCGDCGWTAQNLGKEAAHSAGSSANHYSALVEIGEIAAVILPRSHGRHAYGSDASERMVKTIAARLISAG